MNIKNNKLKTSIEIDEIKFSCLLKLIGDTKSTFEFIFKVRNDQVDHISKILSERIKNWNHHSPPLNVAHNERLESFVKPSQKDGEYFILLTKQCHESDLDQLISELNDENKPIYNYVPQTNLNDFIIEACKHTPFQLKYQNENDFAVSIISLSLESMKDPMHLALELGKLINEKDNAKCPLILNRRKSFTDIIQDVKEIALESKNNKLNVAEMWKAIEEIYKFLTETKNWEIKPLCMVNPSMTYQGCIYTDPMDNERKRHILDINLNNDHINLNPIFCETAMDNHITTILHELVHAVSGQAAFDYLTEYKKHKAPEFPSTDYDLMQELIADIRKYQSTEAYELLRLYKLSPSVYTSSTAATEVISRTAEMLFEKDLSNFKSIASKLSIRNMWALCDSVKFLKKNYLHYMPTLLKKFDSELFLNCKNYDINIDEN